METSSSSATLPNMAEQNHGCDDAVVVRCDAAAVAAFSYIDQDLNEIIANFCDSTDATATAATPTLSFSPTILEEKTSNSPPSTTMLTLPMTAKEKLLDLWRRGASGGPTTTGRASPADVMAAVSQVYAPRHLQRQFQELYSLLHPCLVVRHYNPAFQSDHQQQQQRTSTTTNRSAFLQGARGSGKSLVLQRCLQAFEDELSVKQQQQQQQQQQELQQYSAGQQQNQPTTSFFRIVRIHGILVPGSKVEVVVQEILQQLTRSAANQHQHLHLHQQGNNITAVDVKTKNNNNNNNSNYAAQIQSSDTVSGHSIKNKKSKRQKTARTMKNMDNDSDHTDDGDNDDDADENDPATTPAAAAQQLLHRKKEQSMEHLLRLRRTSFTNHFQLLNEILQYACLDRIPILFILDELDTFVSGGGGGGGGSSKNSNGSGGGSGSGGSNKSSNNNANALTVVNKERQVLLYYLLDRVATQGSFLSLVGLSCHLRTAELLEKRVLSRAMGTARFIGFGPPRDFAQLAEILQDKFQVVNTDNKQSNNKFIATLQTQVAQLLSEPPLHEQQQDDDGSEPTEPTKSCSTSNRTSALLEERQQRRRLYETLERSFRLGKDLRWFSRVFTLALALYRLDCRNAIAASSSASSTRVMRDNENNGNMELPAFHPNYLLEALVDMGASFLTPSGEPDLLAAHNQDCMHRSVSTNGRRTSASSDNISGSVMAEPRMQALRDLCGPQIVLVLAAKRILTRDVQYSTTTTLPPPLTFQRLWQEYNTTYRGNTNRYDRSLVYKAFQDLLAMGLLRPAMDHSGTVPLQYDYHGEFSSLPPSSLALLPLHFNIDIYREMQKAVDGNILDCPAALREWGKKTH
jgi:uncharacterized membrane protein YgcG